MRRQTPHEEGNEEGAICTKSMLHPSRKVKKDPKGDTPSQCRLTTHPGDKALPSTVSKAISSQRTVT